MIPSVPSGLGGLASVSSTGASSIHGPVSIHYAGTGMGGPTIQQCLPKVRNVLNYYNKYYNIVVKIPFCVWFSIIKIFS